MNTQEYVMQVLAKAKEKNKNESEFNQAVEEVYLSLIPILEQRQDLVKANILERMLEPERSIIFKVPWVDDDGNIQVNRGYRVQFNSAIGPYKGGLRFSDEVDLSIIKFLGFEQTFKNALTGLPIGGGKGGADFDPRNKSDKEIMRFCQSFMMELYRHIGGDIDSPAGDIGVGGKEIGYLYGQYKRILGVYDGAGVTGKSVAMGGSVLRPEATGYGIAYFTNEILKDFNDSFEGKTVAASGYGNVCWGICQKVAQLGGKVVTISSKHGYVYDKDGVTTKEKFDFLADKLASKQDLCLSDYAEKFNCEYYDNVKPWQQPVDIVIPSATQNEITLSDAKLIVANKTKYLVEGSNMPTTLEALHYLREHKVIVGPAKAANAGGVSVSALEMSQNKMGYFWCEAEIDEKLQQIMSNIYCSCKNSAKEYGYGYDLVAGANISGFIKVADAMILQGDY